MGQASALRDRYASSDTVPILAVTGTITFLHGVVVALRYLLREQHAQMLGLSAVEWVAFTLGPFLVEPVLLFGVLYYVGVHRDRLPSPPVVLPGLLVAVLVGTALGQVVGEALFPTGWTPLARAGIDVLFTPDRGVLPYWRDLIEPPIRSLLTAVAAVALARSRSRQSTTEHGGR